MRQVASSICTRFAEKLRKLDKSGIVYELHDSPSGNATYVFVADADFARADALCRAVPDRFRKPNRGWR